MSRPSNRPLNSPSFSSSLLDKVFRSIDEELAVDPPNRRSTLHSLSSTPLTTTHQSIPYHIHFKNKPTVTNPVPTNRTSINNLKPIRTCKSSTKNINLDFHQTAPPRSPSFSSPNAKIRTQKIYGELKQPISPGVRLTRFITSLFNKRTSVNKTKHKADNVSIKAAEAGARSTRNVPVNTCSSASSYYRSCLSSKPTTASSKSKVRFCPVDIAVDDRKKHQSRRECEADKRSNLKHSLNKYETKKGVLSVYDDKLSDEYEDDGGSCASSDLFELDHIKGNVNRSINDDDDDELPVFETTKFHSKNHPAIW